MVCGALPEPWRALEPESPLADWPFWNVGRIRPTKAPVTAVRNAAQEDGDAVQGLEVGDRGGKALLGARTAYKVSSG